MICYLMIEPAALRQTPLSSGLATGNPVKDDLG